MRLAHKVAIVTGGGSGIGKAIARAFVREGTQVVISGRNRKKLESAATELDRAVSQSPVTLPVRAILLRWSKPRRRSSSG
jgi:NAD(P)-dependent dehydrogenase (short-subunit alcohol dehydrogenase family)